MIKERKNFENKKYLKMKLYNFFLIHDTVTDVITYNVTY